MSTADTRVDSGEPYRVLHVFDHSLPVHTGYAFRSAAILDEQLAMGWQTWQVTSSKQECPLPEEDAGGHHFFRTQASGLPLAHKPVLEQIDTVYTLRRRLRELLTRLDPQIIHAYSPCLTALAALPVARDHGLPLVYEMRSSWEDAAVTRGTAAPGGIRYRLSRALETRVLTQAAAITTICDRLRDDIIVRGIPPERVTVVPNAVERRMFEPPGERACTLRQKFGAADRKLVGYIGSFHPYEGLDLLIDAVDRLGEQRSQFRFLLAGGGSAEPGIRKRIARLGLSDDIWLLGRVPHQEIPDYYAAMDVLVYPREQTPLTDKVTPLKPLEAMAQRRLVVASDIGGHRELIRNGETGMLFAPGDPDALAAALLDACNDQRAGQILDRAYRFVSQQRTWSHCALKYRDVYHGALCAR
ncbi:MAG TPA: glycosyltransferase, exosortase A system-associated [Chromatiales bacterium]|nr:glycosyltransferase, exosortase A system-associated [Chromatiales bacterium]